MRSRFVKKTCDILRVGEDGFVRVEVLRQACEMGCYGYIVKYVDNGRKAFLPIDSIVEIQESFQHKAKILSHPTRKKSRLKLLKPEQ